MIVLGLNTMENASAALVVDGGIIAAAEEERFTRVKHQEGVPVNAIRYCLEEGGIMLVEVDVVALNWQPWRLSRRVMHVLNLAVTTPGCFMAKAKRGARQVTGNEWWRMLSLPGNLHDLIAPELPKPGYRFKFIDHHLSHAASAFYPSPYSEAAILTLDGAGESACITFNRAGSGGIDLLKSINLPHSLGHLYSAATAFLGFKPCNGEGKVMGLAPYGEANYSHYFEEMITLHEGGGLSVDFKTLDYHLALAGVFTKRAHEIFGEPRQKEGPMEKRHQDIAASLQAVLQKSAIHLAEELYRRVHTGPGPAGENLCLAGGVALNARMNQRIEDVTPFKQVFIQPAASDAGTSLGAALAAAPPSENERSPMTHAFLGPEFSEIDITEAIAAKVLEATYYENIDDVAAGLVAEGKIVGWFQGRMEFGPRALGNRSILADPRNAGMKDILNHRVKHRESFRPFAPAVLADRAAEFFEANGESPFMTKIARVVPGAREKIPAVVHVDGTARLQTVSRDGNPVFYRFIECFCKKTGVPVVLNTSFNIRGEPIVCTPGDAIACYLGTGMDVLAIGNFLLSKSTA
ncbi:MAG: carbamoyltransferase [bacterium]|nr:carbamoyltransferase [bacterium]